MNIAQTIECYKKNKITKKEYIEQMYTFHKILFDYSEKIKETGLKSIEISEDQILVTDKQFNLKIVCPPGDLRVLPIEMLNFGPYEPSELHEILSILELKKPSVIFDIGANIGWYSLVLATVFPDSLIYAFEPVPKIFEYLIRHVKLNKLQNIKPFSEGFSNHEGEVPLYFASNNSVNASLKNVAELDEVEKLTIKTIKLDNFIKTQSLKTIDFIKCDVEGAELLVLQGGEKILNQYKPIIFCEMVRKWTRRFEYHPNNIIDYLKKFNYECFAIRKNGLIKIEKMHEDSEETNFLFKNTDI